LARNLTQCNDDRLVSPSGFNQSLMSTCQLPSANGGSQSELKPIADVRQTIFHGDAGHENLGHVDFRYG